MRLTITEEKKEKDSEKKESKKNEVPEFAKSSRSFIFELLKVVIISLAIIIPIRYFLFQPFYVKGASMEPNFYDNQYLIVDEITYRFTDPARGDVVVIRDPNDKSEFFIKRLIGLPNETLEIKNGKVIIFNKKYPRGITLEEKYLGDGIYTQGRIKVKLDSNEYYVMGDNRPVSLDSRSFGPLPRKLIIGRAWLRVWPFKDWRYFHAFQYDNL